MYKLFPFFAFLACTCLSCAGADDPVIENEEEVITEFIYRLTPAAGGREVLLVFNDPDGDGGQAPTIQVTGSLTPTTTYGGVIEARNLSDPANTVDIAAEIGDEADEHQLFYLPEGGLDVALTYADSDSKGLPVGLVTDLVTRGASSGNLRIILRHEPAKSATGVTISDPAAAGGETDIEVSFPLSVSN